VSYPNLEDHRRYGALRVQGGVPVGAGVGFGIGIHGRSARMRDGEHKSQDWTLGCIALDNPEIEEVAALVPNGAAVVITD
jgi:lipoprotein-anchoring transpeptidase ErfK/SrfK